MCVVGGRRRTLPSAIWSSSSRYRFGTWTAKEVIKYLTNIMLILTTSLFKINVLKLILSVRFSFGSNGGHILAF
jgi:hypothetical protein